MDNSHSSFITISQEDSIAASSQLIKKLFSVIKECPICKNKLKEEEGGVQQAIRQAKERSLTR